MCGLLLRGPGGLESASPGSSGAAGALLVEVAQVAAAIREYGVDAPVAHRRGLGHEFDATVEQLVVATVAVIDGEGHRRGDGRTPVGLERTRGVVEGSQQQLGAIGILW